MIDAASQIMPNAFDAEMADFSEEETERSRYACTDLHNAQWYRRGRQGAESPYFQRRICGGCGDRRYRYPSGYRIPCGFRTGNVQRHDPHRNTRSSVNLPDVYAAGDCAMVKNAITGQAQWSAMGSTANLAARAMAKAMNGAGNGYGGCLGTGVVRLLPTLNGAVQELTEEQAKAQGMRPLP